MFNHDKRFDLDLKYGNIGENFLAECLTNQATIEVKMERQLWKSSGNICIEYESRGKKSGILTSKADYWFHLLADAEGNVEGGYIFPRKQLLYWLRDNKDTLRKVNGGDNYTSKILLVPITRIPEITRHKIPA